ncbi:hypothetical protein QR680_014458 [Steinernema hermaphroditum]|uniref:Peptidase M1 leukotriene A4 hydrolase/aminopeptidase C-terminal domain-containing protein n=1 Tax=Steinernema hermaphroditum TaxID=289476 RepID=A0AA39I8Y2_9BILA|nr:hypothetical protein QR680_014458 [Steinernema hermaphroditum]
MERRDPASCSNIDDFELLHLRPSWIVRFEKKILEGEVHFDLKAKKDIHDLLLDASDLDLLEVKVDGQDAKYELTKQPTAVFGEQLKIELGDKHVGEKFHVFIKFHTRSSATAIQWLDKNQTKDRLQPQVFTYCQPIAARSIMPCADTPAVKCPVTAKLSVPSYVVALMSAVQKGEAIPDPHNDGYMLYEFEQKIPVPSYLVAFIVGKFDSREISHRIRVWAEPSLVDAAAYEFAESEKQLQTAEKILGDYVWGRCDMVVLPPSFPLGGMENPCMIFLTPSLIAGDRSLICLVAHEQIHAWFGNLVTNATWEHEWLNEGFTTYMERRIGALMFGEADRHFCGLNAWSSQLTPCVYEQFHPTHELTKLVQKHDIHQDPNKAFSNIYYEKGQVFLFFLEKKFGVEEFDKYLRDYLKTFAFKSIDSQQWKDHFVAFFQHKKEILDEIDFDLWMYSPGMPPMDPNYDDSFQKACVQYRNHWLETDDENVGNIDIATYKKFTPHQKEEFLNLLRQAEPLSIAKVKTLTEKLNLENEHNCEIRHYWIRLCLKARWDHIVKIAHEYVLHYGRMKLVRYIYRDLFEWTEHAEETKKLFEANKPYMHAISIRCIESDMNAAAGAA